MFLVRLGRLGIKLVRISGFSSLLNTAIARQREENPEILTNLMRKRLTRQRVKVDLGAERSASPLKTPSQAIRLNTPGQSLGNENSAQSFSDRSFWKSLSVVDVRAFGSWMSAPKCLFFQDFDRPDRSFGSGYPRE